jgi:hypothetical protein
MDKKTKIAVSIIILLTSIIAVQAVENDYLALSEEPRLTHTEKINSGDPYTAEISLQRVGIIPRQANLSISTSAVNPIIKLTIDGEEQTFSSQMVTQELSEEGVSTIEVTISGNAATVSTDTVADMVLIITEVVYDDINKGPQEEIRRSITVTNPEIEDAVRAINNAKSKLLQAETSLSDLKAEDRDITDLETRLEIARDMIEDAENSKTLGFPLNAKRQADNSIISLESIIADAQNMTQREIDIQKYATVVVVIIIALIGISVLRRKREELG